MSLVTRPSGLALLAGAILAVSACDQEQTIVVPSTAALDGFAYAGAATGANATSGVPVTGDLDASIPGVRYRQFYSFGISSLPADAEITSATLRLYQVAVAGQPYTDFGNLVLDHVDYGTLDAADYNLAALASAFATLATGPDTAYLEVDVLAQVQADHAAGRPNSGFRVRFANADGDNDAASDYVTLIDAEHHCCSSAGNLPELVIRYR